MDSKISVIIPVYNSEKEINKTLVSVINQSFGFENIEVIVVDDCSTDNTPNILKEYSNKHSNIKSFFLEKNNGSPGKGRNIGIQNASSDYIMFLDSDDAYDVDYCEKMYSTISEYDVDIVMCRHKIIDGDNNVSFRDYKLNSSSKDIIICNPKEEPAIFNDPYIWNKIFKKEFLINNVIKFPDGWFEDVYFVIKSFLNTEKLVFLNNYYGYYYYIINWEGKKVSKTFIISITNFEKTCNLFNKINQNNLFLLMFKRYYTGFLIHFVNLSGISYNEKIKLLDLLYDIQIKFDFNEKLDEIWAELLNKNIKSKNYKIVIYLSKIMFILLNSNFIKDMYSKIYGGVKK